MPADGATLVSTSPRCLPHVTTNPERLSSHMARARSRSIRQRERDDYGMGVGGGDEIGEFLLEWRSAHPLPLGGGERKIMILAPAKS